MRYHRSVVEAHQRGRKKTLKKVFQRPMVSLMTREDIILGRNMDFCSKEGRDGPLTPNRVRQGGRWWWGRPPPSGLGVN